MYIVQLLRTINHRLGMQMQMKHERHVSRVPSSGKIEIAVLLGNDSVEYA